MADERDADGAGATGLPPSAVEEAERLTRLARDAVDEEEADAYRDRRASLLDEYGFTARVREDDDGETLVCHPREWLDETGVVDVAAIEDTDRAAEVRLSGPDDQGVYEEAEDRNRPLVEAIREDHDPVHAANARAFADFMGNHYASPVDDATARHVREFLEEYYPRNAWPTDEQAAVVEASLRRLFEEADEPYPLE
ncbi:MAG: rnhA operon protein [Halanaeroarchaeum sp.]